jgi:hypothetical protein
MECGLPTQVYRSATSLVESTSGRKELVLFQLADFMQIAMGLLFGESPKSNRPAISGSAES